jgi:hypothetical protein
MRRPSGVCATGGLDRRSHFDSGRVFRPAPVASAGLAPTDGELAGTDRGLGATDRDDAATGIDIAASDVDWDAPVDRLTFF